MLCGAQQHPRGCSSVGRALRSHRRGRGFDYHQLHEDRCIHSTAAVFFFFSRQSPWVYNRRCFDSRQPLAPGASGQLSTQAAVRAGKDSGHTFWPGAKARPPTFEPMKPYAPQDLRHDSRHTFWPITRDFGRLQTVVMLCGPEYDFCLQSQRFVTTISITTLVCRSARFVTPRSPKHDFRLKHAHRLQPPPLRVVPSSLRVVLARITSLYNR